MEARTIEHRVSTSLGHSFQSHALSPTPIMADHYTREDIESLNERLDTLGGHL